MAPPKRALIAVTSAHAPLYPDNKETGYFITEVLHLAGDTSQDPDDLAAAAPEPGTLGLGGVLDEGHAAPRDAAAAAFARWTALLADSLRSAGADSTAAEQIANLIVASVEGTVAICRAQRSIAPLDHVAAQLVQVIRASLSS